MGGHCPEEVEGLAGRPQEEEEGEAGGRHQVEQGEEGEAEEHAHLPGEEEVGVEAVEEEHPYCLAKVEEVVGVGLRDMEEEEQVLVQGQLLFPD